MIGSEEESFSAHIYYTPCSVCALFIFYNYHQLCRLDETRRLRWISSKFSLINGKEKKKSHFGKSLYTRHWRHTACTHTQEYILYIYRHLRTRPLLLLYVLIVESINSFGMYRRRLLENKKKKRTKDISRVSLWEEKRLNWSFSSIGVPKSIIIIYTFLLQNSWDNLSFPEKRGMFWFFVY